MGVGCGGAVGDAVADLVGRGVAVGDAVADLAGAAAAAGAGVWTAAISLLNSAARDAAALAADRGGATGMVSRSTSLVSRATRIAWCPRPAEAQVPPGCAEVAEGPDGQVAAVADAAVATDSAPAATRRAFELLS